jgi:cellulose synthase/poly-beta-1,6-N-acetylglucosamine synthase-like glycosyltransferase
MKGLLIVNLIIGVIFVLCYGYQLAYIFIAYLKKDKPLPPEKENLLAVLICARNEEKVIPRLIGSLKKQSYDASR